MYKCNFLMNRIPPLTKSPNVVFVQWPWPSNYLVLWRWTSCTRGFNFNFAARLPSYGLSAVEQICDTRRVRCQNGTCARTYRSGAKHRRVWKHGSRASAQFPQVSAHARSRARDGGASGRIGPAPRQALWRAAAKSVSGQHICKYIGIYVYIYY